MDAEQLMKVTKLLQELVSLKSHFTVTGTGPSLVYKSSNTRMSQPSTEGSGTRTVPVSPSCEQQSVCFRKTATTKTKNVHVQNSGLCSTAPFWNLCIMSIVILWSSSFSLLLCKHTRTHVQFSLSGPAPFRHSCLDSSQ